MRVLRAYTAQALSAPAIITLDETASHHLGRVLRVKPGQAVVVFNGNGGEYAGNVHAVDRRSVQVQLTRFDAVERERATAVHLGLALIKPDRFAWAVEKATELGVAAITPLITRYTDKPPTQEQAEKRRAHWQQIAISACEQSGRNRIPVIHAPQALNDWLVQRDEALRLVADPAGSKAVTVSPPASAALLIGPEGGLTPEEVQAAEQAGFQRLGLGPAILRAETAALTALVGVLA